MKLYLAHQERKEQHINKNTLKLFLFVFVPIALLLIIYTLLVAGRFKSYYQKSTEKHVFSILNNTENLFIESKNEENQAFLTGEYYDLLASGLFPTNDEIESVNLQDKIHLFMDSYTRNIGNGWIKQQKFSLPASTKIISKDGEVLLSSLEDTNETLNPTLFKRIMTHNKDQGSMEYRIPETAWGVPYLIFFIKNESTEIITLLEVSQDAYFSPLYSYRIFLMIVMGFILVVLSVLIYSGCYYLFKSLASIETGFGNLINENNSIEIRRSNIFTKGAYAVILQFNDFFQGISDQLKDLSSKSENSKQQTYIYNNRLTESLAEAKNQLNEIKLENETRIEENKKQQWISDGISKISDIIRRNTELKAMGEQIVCNLAEYLEMNQVALFSTTHKDTHTEQEKFLTLQAAFAYNRLRFKSVEVKFGEGVLGECAKSGKSLVIKDIPDNYLTITSGLGKAKPTFLFLQPLEHEKEVYGVLELASFTPLNKNQIDFLNQVSEIIASAIATLIVNENTNNLLRETKEQADKMANQEEELRQTLEELQTTQDQMTLKNKEIEELNADYKSKEAKYIDQIKLKDIEIERLRKQIG